MKRINLIALAAYVMLLGCEAYQKNPNYQAGITDKVDLVEIGELVIKLDSLTPYYTDCIQYYESKAINDTAKFIVAFNKSRSVIDFYSYTAGLASFSHRLDLHKTGIKELVNIDGFSLLNKDSIILISAKHNFAQLLNTKGDTLKQFVLDTTVQANFFANPIATTYTPAYRDKDWILINGFLGPKINIERPLNKDVENLCLKLNLKTGEQIAVMSYPDAYKGKMWTPNMLFFYRTFNEDKKEFVYSFPADHNVTITDFKNRSKSMLAGSKYFEKIKPFSKDQMAYAEREAYFYNTPSYGPIIYDKFQKLYFRIAHQQISEEDRQSKDINRSTIKHASIIILDEHFNRVGETLLPRFSFTETMFFVTENGLHFGKWGKSKLDEDFLVFGIFKARKK